VTATLKSLSTRFCEKVNGTIARNINVNENLIIAGNYGYSAAGIRM
jgi:hypothetical protein